MKDRANNIATLIILKGNAVEYKNVAANGVPFISVAKKGRCIIGDHFSMNNNTRGNPIGRIQKCSLFVDNDAELIIGNHVGISSTAIVAKKSVRIGNHVKIGGGTCIYDTDFHSLNPETRKEKSKDVMNANHAPVIIGDNVFIGAHTTILKGVTVGDNSIIGACSVVTKSIPANEIWAGNPARFIKRI